MSTSPIDMPKPVDVLISEFSEALHGRRIAFADRKDRGAPLHAHAQAHRRLFRQFSDTIDAVEAMEVGRRDEKWQGCQTSLPQKAADSAQDLYYRATELFDFYALDLPSFLGASPSHAMRTYRSSVKWVRDYWATTCNRCKHNHRFTLPVELAYSDADHVTGISVYGRIDDYLSPDRISLQGADLISYNWMFRRLLGMVVYADAAAAALVRTIADQEGPEPISSGSYELPYSTLVRKILSRSALAMPKEPRGPAIRIDSEAKVPTIVVAFDEMLPPEERGADLRLWIDFLGPSVRLKLPYGMGDVAAKLGPDHVMTRPLGGFLRMQITSKVPPMPN